MPQTKDRTSEALEEERMSIIRDLVEDAKGLFYDRLQTKFGVRGTSVGQGRSEIDLDLALHAAAEEWFSSNHPGFLDEVCLGKALMDFLPPGLAHLVSIMHPASSGARVTLYLGEVGGMFWQVFPGDDEDESWVMQLFSPVALPLTDTILLDYGLTTPASRATMVARDVLDRIGWPRFSTANSLLLTKGLANNTPFDLVVGMSAVFGEVEK